MSKSSKEICKALTRKGNPCKNQAVKNGFCNAHQSSKVTVKKEAKVAQPVGGPEEFSSLIDAVNTGAEQADGNIKLDFVGGQWTEVPVEDVADDVVKKSEELALRYDTVQADTIIDQYKALLKYVPEDAIKDKCELAAILVDVVRLSQEEVEQQFALTTDAINRLSLTVKHLREDSKAEYGSELPLDIKMQIAALDKEIFQLKKFKAILTASIEIYEEGIKQAEEEEKQHQEFESRESRNRGFFKKFLGWANKNSKAITAMCIILAGIAMLFIALMPSNIVQPPANESIPPMSVVNEEPVGEHVPANFADVSDAKPAVGQSVVVKKSTMPGGKVTVPDFIGLSDAARVAAVDVPIVSYTYTVHDGDTLWDIAVKVYGDGSQWTHIWDMNKDALIKADARNATDAGHWIYAGQSLHVNMSDALNNH